MNPKESARDTLLSYYRNVQGYHHVIEQQCLDAPMIPSTLLRRLVRPAGIIVDIAGGSGINANILNLNPDQYVCVDVSWTGLAHVDNLGRGSPVQADAAALPFCDQSIDRILCSWSLEHLVEAENTMREMVRVLKPNGRIVIWGPNWDNIFRKDFPQFAHKHQSYIRRVRRRIFFNMIRNEFLPFHYRPYINADVAALFDPQRYISADTDAVHCTLCQETLMWFKQNGMKIVYIADFSVMQSFVNNGRLIRLIRIVLRPLLPVLRCIPLVRWFVIRFPLVVERVGENA